MEFKPNRFFGPDDTPSPPLEGERVAVLGYGHLGRTAALNLRDSGVNVRIGNVKDAFAEQARGDGFEVVPLREASGDDIVYVLLPDEVIPVVWAEAIAPGLRPGAAVAFASGYCLAFSLVTPPADVDVLLVAPRMAGETARQRYLDGQGFWAYIGVEAAASDRAEQRMLGLTAGIGALRAGALEMGATMEATIDLFVEQTVGPFLGMAIMLAFEIGTRAGIPAEALVLEMYMSGEFETVFQSFRKEGFYKSSEAHGPTALFGGMTRTMELDRAAMLANFERVLADIRNGGFAERFEAEREAGYPMLAMARTMTGGDTPIRRAEDEVRAAIAARNE